MWIVECVIRASQFSHKFQVEGRKGKFERLELEDTEKKNVKHYVKHLDEPARSRFCEKIAHPCVLVLIRDVSVNRICEKTTSLHHMFRCSDWL